jgi:hypothetical protein
LKRKRITVDLTPEQHKRFVNAKMERGEKSLQALMIGATDLLLSADGPATRSPLTNPGESATPEDGIGENPESVLQIQGTGIQGTQETWEHRAVDTILQTDYAEAFRVNIRAVHLLATGEEPDVSVPQTNPDAGPKPLPGRTMEEVHKGIGDLEQTVAAEEKNLGGHRLGRKRSGKPQTGTD